MSIRTALLVSAPFDTPDFAPNLPRSSPLLPFFCPSTEAFSLPPPLSRRKCPVTAHTNNYMGEKGRCGSRARRCRRRGIRGHMSGVHELSTPSVIQEAIFHGNSVEQRHEKTRFQWDLPEHQRGHNNGHHIPPLHPSHLEVRGGGMDAALALLRLRHI